MVFFPIYFNQVESQIPQWPLLTLIDNIYSNNFSGDIFGGNRLMEIADHLARFISVKKDTRNKAQPNYYKRDYTKWHDENFLDDLSIQKWENDLLYRIWMKYMMTWGFKSCVNTHALWKKVNKREQKLINKPWITPYILKKIKHTNDIFVRKKAKPEDEHLNT